MKRILNECLRLLCEMCGAQSVRLRVAFREADKEIVILDARLNASAVSPAEPDNQEPPVASTTMAGLFSEGVIASEQSVSACGADVSSYSLKPTHGSADTDRVEKRIFLPEQPIFRLPDELDSVSGQAESAVWELGSCIEWGKWRFRGIVKGLYVEVSMILHEWQAGFIHKRLCTAGSFLRLLESIVSELEISCPQQFSDHCGDIPLDPPLIGRSSMIVGLRRRIRKISDCDIPLLVEGESGTGKEVVAHNVHRLSPRRHKPFVIVNCMEISPSLLQSELFGHLKGSFTGASRDRIGLIESAGGGTFFLDEIGEMPPHLQATLLRVLQEKEVRRIGDCARRKVDVRFVLATNKELLDLVKRGKFREDLYFRVNGIRLYISPLRQRREDIIPLAEHFLELGAGRIGTCVPAISASAAKRMLEYDWPGNVRELKHEMERIVVLNRGTKTVITDMLSPHIVEAVMVKGLWCEEGDGTLPGAVQRLERRMITDALERFSGNRTRTAGALGITRQGLLKKLKRYGMK